MGTKSVWSTLQLWTLLFRDTIGAIDALTRRVGCWKMDHLVWDLWICYHFGGAGMGVNIRSGTIVLDIGQWSSDSRSILPRYVIKSGSACIDCTVCVGNPLHSHKMTSKTKTSRFPQTYPPQYHFLNRYAYLRQIDNCEASNPTVCIHAKVR